jgi:DDE superfamily endonuclease
VLLLDRAGWHIAGDLVWPKNITPILLPSRSLELNPVENIWQHLRANHLSNRVFETDNEISTSPATPGDASQKGQLSSPHWECASGRITVRCQGRWDHMGQISMEIALLPGSV